MTYNEIKSHIDTCRKDILGVKKSIKLNEDERVNLEQSTRNIESSYQFNLREEKDKALKEYVESCTASLDKELDAAKQEFNEKQDSFKQQLSELDNVDVSKSYTNEQSMMAEIRSALNVLQDQLNKNVSKRFQSELNKQIESQVVQIQENDIDTIVQFFNKQSKNIAKMSKSNNITKFIDKILTVVRVPLPEETESRKGKVTFGVISVIIVLVFLLSAKVIFPFYVLFLFLLFIYNINKQYQIYTALLAQKVVADNLAKIDESLFHKAQQRLGSKKKKLQEKCDKELLALQQKIDDLQSKRSLATEEANGSFHFDASMAQERYQNALKINSTRMNALQSTYAQLTEQLNTLQNELSGYEQEMNQFAGGMQDEYLNFEKIGSSAVFDNKFIFDIKKFKPKFFEHPKQSVLFLYDNHDDVVDFIRLILIQLRIKLSPHNLNCTVIDIEGFGIPYLSFNTDSEDADEAMRKLFRIITDTTEVKNVISEYRDVVNKRIMTIRSSYDNIDEYNRDMLESDSLTETYDFLFYDNPQSQSLNDENFRKLYMNGGSVGVYTHIFIKRSDFYEMGDLARSLIEGTGGIYIFSGGEILRRAKQFAHENLVKNKN